MKKLLVFLSTLIFAISSGICAFAAGRIVSTADFSAVSYGKFENRVSIKFDINANTLSDGIVGIASSDITPADYSDYAICFRIRKGGFFDTNNGSNFNKDNEIKYLTGKTYNVEIIADTKNKVYNAYVYIDGEKNTVCENYAFRAKSDNLGKVTARGGGGVQAGLYYIENIEFAQEEGELEMFSLANFYCENMVLQRGEAIRVSGRAAKGDITATLKRGDIVKSATASAKEGEFEIFIPSVPANLEPYTLTVESKDRRVIIENVFVGDVFLLAGQSNMAQNYNFQTTEQLGNGIGYSNLPERVVDERIKHFTINQTESESETFDVPFKNGGWQSLSADNNKQLSYIGMFFAKERLKCEENVPVGIISTAWNGTTINRWMRKSDDNKTIDYTPTNGKIFNNHISPLVKYPIKAILYYQGESDSGISNIYADIFRNLIRDWRRLWNDDELPFLFVQLARYSKDNYAPQREAQMKVLSEKNTGMAVILDTDMGTYDNIHPLGKEKVAERLNLLARKYAYKEDIVAEGPIFEKAEVLGNEIKIYFREDTIGDGLCLSNTYSNTDNELCEFEICEKGGEFVKAKAVINSDNTISLTGEGIENPAFARYAYSAVPQNPNLFNKNGLPAAPFRTDERIESSDSFVSKGFEIDNSNVQIAEFCVIPKKNGINGVISFTDKENSITAWNSAAVTIRFENKGFFEYIDADGFKTGEIPFEKGKEYNVKIICDFTKKTYSVIINNEILCINASFRTGALDMNNMGRFMIRGGSGEAFGEFYADSYPIVKALGENEYVATSDGEETVYFAVNGESDMFAASYKEGFMIDAVKRKGEDALEIMRLKKGDEEKVFNWDNMKPVK